MKTMKKSALVINKIMKAYNLILAIFWLGIATIAVLKNTEVRYIMIYCTFSVISAIVGMTYSIKEDLKNK